MSATLIVLALRQADGKFARRAQLDALLRSVAEHWPRALLRTVDAPAGAAFDEQLHEELEAAAELCCFATDDSIFTSRVPHQSLLQLSEGRGSVLCYSLRLGANTTRCYPTGAAQAWPGYEWRWPDEEGDFGYPGSVDGTVYRREDIFRLLDGQYLDNPTALEVTLDERCRELQQSRPRMTSPPLSCYLSVPVNRVSAQSGVIHGTRFPQPAGQLNARYDNGERIDLRATLAGVTIDAAHVELEYQWTV